MQLQEKLCDCVFTPDHTPTPRFLLDHCRVLHPFPVYFIAKIEKQKGKQSTNTNTHSNLQSQASNTQKINQKSRRGQK